MRRMMERIGTLLVKDDGQGLAEYALIVALIAIGVVVTLGTVGTAIRNKLTDLSNRLNNASAG